MVVLKAGIQQPVGVMKQQVLVCSRLGLMMR